MKDAYKVPDDFKELVLKLKNRPSYQEELDDEELIQGSNVFRSEKEASEEVAIVPSNNNQNERELTRTTLHSTSSPNLLHHHQQFSSSLPNSPNIRHSKHIPSNSQHNTHRPRTAISNNDKNYDGQSFLPKISDLVLKSGKDLTPQIPPILRPERKQAWMSSTNSRPNSSYNNRDIKKEKEEEMTKIMGEETPFTNPLFPLQAEGIINAGLLKLSAKLCEDSLPYNALRCPQAIEAYLVNRIKVSYNLHKDFLNNMIEKLNEKIILFLHKKDDEINSWIDADIKNWEVKKKFNDDEFQFFLKSDLQRLAQKASNHTKTSQIREYTSANELDHCEREQTQLFILDFQNSIHKVHKDTSDLTDEQITDSPNSYEQLILNNTINNTVTNIDKENHMELSKNTSLKFKIFNQRKREEAFDWLCSLSDNALTASISEGKLKEIYQELDK